MNIRQRFAVEEGCVDLSEIKTARVNKQWRRWKEREKERSAADKTKG